MSTTNLKENPNDVGIVVAMGVRRSNVLSADDPHVKEQL